MDVGAVNVRSGNLVHVDTAQRRLRAEHFMASGALPPGFPAVEIDGEYYWDGCTACSRVGTPHVLIAAADVEPDNSEPERVRP